MDENFIKNIFQTVLAEGVQVKVIRDRNSGYVLLSMSHLFPLLLMLLAMPRVTEPLLSAVLIFLRVCSACWRSLRLLEVSSLVWRSLRLLEVIFTSGRFSELAEDFLNLLGVLLTC